MQNVNPNTDGRVYALDIIFLLGNICGHGYQAGRKRFVWNHVSKQDLHLESSNGTPFMILEMTGPMEFTEPQDFLIYTMANFVIASI